MKEVSIGNRLIGDGNDVFIIAEIGINHNGDLDTAFNLIDAAIDAGCDAVKFQKRTIDVVYTKEELDKLRETPFGKTNRDLKNALELGKSQYEEINRYCGIKNIMWFASCWDEASVDFIEKFKPPCYKIASASLTDDNLLRYTRSKNMPVIISTGMSTIEQIKHAVSVLGEDNLVILHCTSTYPSRPEELNLKVIGELKKLFHCPIGYSGHEVGVVEGVLAVAFGACVVERHITLDRAMWGSDQAASLEPQGLTRLVKDIREISVVLGDGVKRVYDSEMPIIKKLRRK